MRKKINSLNISEITEKSIDEAQQWFDKSCKCS